ncbi:MAG: nitroreductase/quinone reductase family protein [Nocardioides sp.]
MQLPRVDPLRPHGLATRALHLVGRSAVGRWYGIHVAARADAALLRRTGVGSDWSARSPTATLATTGARSGLRRETPVVYFHDGDDVILVASSFGRDRHPGWYHNALAHPDVQLNGLPFRAAEVTDESEYERLYGLATRVYGGYADYRVRTATAGRRIPVLRLTPTG